jgi:hypothetical protein
MTRIRAGAEIGANQERVVVESCVELYAHPHTKGDRRRIGICTEFVGDGESKGSLDDYHLPADGEEQDWETENYRVVAKGLKRIGHVTEPESLKRGYLAAIPIAYARLKVWIQDF